jgi:acetyltransferase
MATGEALAYRIRPITADDRNALACFYAGLSSDSLEARFHGGTPGLGERTTRRLCGPDHDHREGLVAETVDDDPVRIVGHVCLEPTGDGSIEVAIAVADAWQRHGVGHALMSAAIDWCRAHGITRLLASMRWSNGAVLGLMRAMGCPVRFGADDGGVVDVSIDLRGRAPTAADALPHAA